MTENITLPKDKYDSMKETLEVLSDPELLKDIRDGIEEIQEGRTVSLDKYSKK
ncbi:hypothetical protein ISS07_04205 [Candidatus Woesearchaeota archaeon]|nr:hypothetical protein [Candidatus Woesearchaeota archaeon]